jgi:hypothetical protein
LDAVLSTRKHKTFRYGNNWVLLGLVISMPFRRDRPFCIPLLWRIYEKRGTKTKAEHKTKIDLAADALRTLAGWLPGHEIIAIADSAYMAKGLLKDRPSNVNAIGPICWTAALTDVIERDGKGESTGERLPPLRKIMANNKKWPPQERTIWFTDKKNRRLEIKMLLACWPTVVGESPVAIVLVRDPAGEWRDEALVSTNPELTNGEIVTGYCQRWSVEVAFADAKQQLGFHDPCVWKAESVERAAPMAWFVGALVMLWYAEHGEKHRAAKRHQPWYNKEVITFSDMLSCCRLALWENWRSTKGDACPANRVAEDWLLEYLSTAA